MKGCVFSRWEDNGLVAADSCHTFSPAAVGEDGLSDHSLCIQKCGFLPMGRPWPVGLAEGLRQLCLCSIVAGGAGSQPGSVARGCRRCSRVSGQTLPIAISHQYFVREREENWPTFSQATKKK